MAKILIVDDDKSIVELLQTLLTHKGYEVETAENGKIGLAAARKGTPELIILDVMMPEMDGFTVSGLLFQDPVMRRIPVIILTARSQARDILELVPNVRFYMTKPFDPQDLLNRVQSMVPIQSKAA